MARAQNRGGRAENKETQKGLSNRHRQRGSKTQERERRTRTERKQVAVLGRDYAIIAPPGGSALTRKR